MNSTRITLVATLLLACITEGDASDGSDFSSERPNSLFIVSDDHGWGDLPSNWDKTEVRLPNLDALSNSGARFQNYHTVPLCGPSRACMFTGQYSTENGMWRGPGQQPLGSPGYRGIKRNVKMLSEFLSEAGYQTGAFGKWHMGALKGEVPNDRGFDEFHGFLAGAHPYWAKPGRSKLLHNRDPDLTADGHTTELFTEWAEKFIQSSVEQKTPFFCYLAYNAVHGPIRIDRSKPASAPDEWIQRALDRGVSFLRSDYVAILEHMDHHIGRLVEGLETLGVAENTIIVFVSDNGGCVMDEDAAGGRFPGNNGPFRGGKATTYQGGINVPFLVHWKNRIPSLVSNEQVMHCDIFSTLLDAAKIEVPKTNGNNPMRGKSLMPHLLSSGKEKLPERTMIFELWGNIGVRKGNYKLWSQVGREYSPDWPALISEVQQTDLFLYDLGRDVNEETDLREELPEVYAALKTALINHLVSLDTVYPTDAISDHPKSTDLSPLKPSPKSGSSQPNSTPRSKQKFFNARDRNSDGQITLEEFIGNPANRNVPVLTKRFNLLDRNADEKLTIDELN